MRPPRLATSVVSQEQKTEAFKLLMKDDAEGLEKFLEPVRPPAAGGLKPPNALENCGVSECL